MRLDYLVRQTAYLFTAYADYSFSKRGMIISTALAHTIFENRLKKLPPFARLSFEDVLDMGRRENVWQWEGDISTGLIVMRWESDPPQSFARRPARLKVTDLTWKAGEAQPRLPFAWIIDES